MANGRSLDAASAWARLVFGLFLLGSFSAFQLVS